MSTQIYNIINNVSAQIVKYGTLKNLIEFNNSLPAEERRLPPNAFTRSRKMPLSDIIKFLILPRAESSTVELLRYSQLIHKSDVTKNDFSRRRGFIHYSYLKSLNESVLNSYYDSDGTPDRWHGYYLWAGDGTTWSLPQTKTLRDAFLKGRKTGHGQHPLARGVVVKDVLNDLIISADMEGYGRDEIKLLINQLENLPACFDKEPVLMVLDRKFCAYTLISRLLSLGMDFVIRVKSRFNVQVDEFIESGQKERIVTLNPASATVKKLRKMYGKSCRTQGFKVKLVRLPKDVVVMTSLMEEGLLTGDTESDIYHKRWNDETTIGFMKNSLQVEIFSGLTVNSIQQDFYSKIISYNILSLLVMQAAVMRHANKPSDNSRKYGINRNVALGIYRLYMPMILQCESNLDTGITKMLNLMSRYVTRIVPDRHNPRVFRKIKHNGKYITLTNYARVI